MCHRLEKRPQLARLQWRPAFSKQPWQRGGGVDEIAFFFYPQNAWKALSKTRRKWQFLSHLSWKSNLCPHDGGKTDALQYKVLLKVVMPLDQRETHTHTLQHLSCHPIFGCVGSNIFLMTVSFHFSHASSQFLYSFSLPSFPSFLFSPDRLLCFLLFGTKQGDA